MNPWEAWIRRTTATQTHVAGELQIKQIAEHLDLPESTVRSWFGPDMPPDPRPDAMRKLARAFGITLADAYAKFDECLELADPPKAGPVSLTRHIRTTTGTAKLSSINPAAPPL